MQKGSAVWGPDRILYGLIFLAMFLSLGHHFDHIIRGNNIGWPLTAELNPFTYSLGIYPLILLGLYLYASGRVGAGFWALLSGSGAIFLHSSLSGCERRWSIASRTSAGSSGPS